MFTEAQLIIQTGRDLPAGIPRWGATITCVSTQCPATLQDHKYLQLHFTWWWGGLSTRETAKISATHPPMHFHAGFGSCTGKPHSPALPPPYTMSFALHCARHKNQTEKITLERESTPPAGFSLCLYTPSWHWDSKLFGTKVRSNLLLQSQCCISRCHEHKAFCPLSPNARKLHGLFSTP